MKMTGMLLLPGALAILVFPLWARPKETSTFARSAAAKMADETLGPVLNDEATLDELRSAMDKAIESLSGPSPVVDRLSKLRGEEDRAALRKGLDGIRESLTFEPKKEGEMPPGFPTYTPDGVVEVKSYPTYRRAEAKGFFTLFRHITTRNIEMTVPVEVAVDAERGQARDWSMAFLYGDQSIGKLGKQGNVTVVDVPAKTVVAVGLRGEMNQANLRRGQNVLEKWLEAHPEYEAVGEPLYLSYNSPGVGVANRIGELQIPILNMEAKQ